MFSETTYEFLLNDTIPPNRDIYSELSFFRVWALRYADRSRVIIFDADDENLGDADNEIFLTLFSGYLLSVIRTTLV